MVNNTNIFMNATNPVDNRDFVSMIMNDDSTPTYALEYSYFNIYEAFINLSKFMIGNELQHDDELYDVATKLGDDISTFTLKARSAFIINPDKAIYVNPIDSESIDEIVTLISTISKDINDVTTYFKNKCIAADVDYMLANNITINPNAKLLFENELYAMEKYMLLYKTNVLLPLYDHH